MNIRLNRNYIVPQSAKILNKLELKKYRYYVNSKNKKIVHIYKYFCKVNYY